MRERRENRMKRAVREAGAWALAAALTLTAVLVPADTLQAAGSGQSSYRGSGDNMAILTDARTVANLPKSLEETEVKWTVQVAEDPSDWTNAITSPVEVDGTIYVLSNGRLKAFDAVTGKLAKAASDEDLINNYYNYYLMGGKVNGETMLFVESQNIVAAYNSDLEQVWKTRSEDVAYGNDGYAPMYLSDGVIYGLTTSYSGSSAGAFAIDAVSGAYLWQTEVPFTAAGQGSWAMGGGYSGMVAAGDYVICGTEGGTVYVFAKSNGAVVSQLDASADHMQNIRGAIAYTGGNLWFTMTDGSIWRVAFSESDGALGAVSSAKITPTATNSTATPVVYNGRVYVGCTDTDASGSVQGAVAVLDASTLAMWQNRTTHGPTSARMWRLQQILPPVPFTVTRLTMISREVSWRSAISRDRLGRSFLTFAIWCPSILPITATARFSLAQREIFTIPTTADIWCVWERKRQMWIRWKSYPEPEAILQRTGNMTRFLCPTRPMTLSSMLW